MSKSTRRKSFSNRPKAVVSLLWASVVFVLFIGLIVLVNIAACIFL